MGEIPKPDDLINRLVSVDERITTLEASGRRRVLVAHDSTPQSTSSTVFVDVGPVLTNVRPGPSGLLLVGLDAEMEVSVDTEVGYVGYRLSVGPTVVAPDENFSLVTSGPTATQSATRWVPTPVLADGLYTVTLVYKSLFGTLISVLSHGIYAMPI